MSVSPALDTVYPGYTAQLTATPRNAAGQPLSGKAITWSSVVPLVATVSDSGLVTGVAVGAATIDATVEGVTGNAEVTVLHVPVGSVSVTPAIDTLLWGDTLRLTATPKGPLGEPLSGLVILWASSAPGVATVSHSGLVTAAAPGVATIVASVEGVTGAASMTIRLLVDGVWDWTEDIAACHDTGTYVFQQTGTAFVGRTDQVGTCSGLAGEFWRNDQVGGVVHSGLITGATIAFTTGNCTYTATAFRGTALDSLRGSALCFGGASSGTWRAVPARPVASATFAADTVHAVLSWPRRPPLVLKDALGNRVFRPAAWSSTAPLVASVDSAGLISGLAVGTADLIATVGGLADTTTVAVTNPRMAFLSRHDGTAQVYTMNADASNLAQLTQGVDWGIGPLNPSARDVLAWSPDGMHLVLKGGYIFVISASNGTDARTLWQDGNDPAWSPDGTRIRLFAGGGVYDVSVDGLDTTLVATPNFQATGPLAWSPDLAKVAFPQTTNFFTTVYTANVDGSGLGKLTPSNWAEGSPAWSPDGTQIVVSSAGHGVAIVKSDGSGPITSLAWAPDLTTIYTRSAWSPDVSYVAFARIVAGPSFEVWVTDISGTVTPRRISPDGYDAWAPAFWR